MNTGITDVCTRCLCSAGAQAPGFMHTGRISSSCPHLTTAPFLLVHTQNLESLLPAPILPHSTSMSPHPQIHWPSFKIQPNAFFTECGNALLIHLFASSLAPFLLHTIIPAGLPKGRMDCIHSSAQMPHSSRENQHPHKGLQGLPKVSSHSQHPCERVLSTPDSLTPLQPYCVPGWSLNLPSVSPSRHLVVLISLGLHRSTLSQSRDPCFSSWDLYSRTSTPIILAAKRLRLQKGVSV